uniref:FO synthase n=1 Tax=Chromera velia CCMP2878 TaxID=1169474 RepID=A0A0G4HBX6_9ALVE|eukprot:Cvel_6268.t1-p1 / transcript=Cvel_6268.t1 / gene=Cvel_6268 / organism=Chromera_velia_CCMP2878 / gene_product=FO synthase, putative / transcript_product=FO synthase, putative / location=Cvel_scaffold304:1860-7052(-) / protein_length=947 / sequence_SO=supercontig / SO=protein_coding / is_pseudo=false
MFLVINVTSFKLPASPAPGSRGSLSAVRPAALKEEKNGDGVSAPSLLSEAEISLVVSPLPEIVAKAGELRDQRYLTPSGLRRQRTITYSRKVFLPLTHLCRDRCHYCTFAQPPKEGSRAFMTAEEVLEVAREGAKRGCTEALFTLGDRPETRWQQAKEELEALGFTSTVDYLAHCMGEVLRETGLLPHANAGVLSKEELLKLRAVSASQGLMLETISTRLGEKGGPHYGSPDKIPAKRLEVIRLAGELKIPFTSGLLVGIGETRMERLEALAALRELHRQYGHLQEVIIQPFRAKEGTKMFEEGHPDCSFEELLWTVACARLILGSSVNIQAPPNLSSLHELPDLLAAGINDWGGVSPVTADFVNPEKPWPEIETLSEITEREGFVLLPRLPSYPEYCAPTTAYGPALRKWYAPQTASALLQSMDAGGLSRKANGWVAGEKTAVPVDGPDEKFIPGSSEAEPFRAWMQDVFLLSRETESEIERESVKRVTVGGGATETIIHGRGEEREARKAAWHGRALSLGVSPVVLSLIEKVVWDGLDLEESEIAELFRARGADVGAVCAAADWLRRAAVGPDVSYAVVRNINYTNMCSFACGFCAFSKGRGKTEEGTDLRGKPYNVPLEEITRRATEAWERGGTEVCMQGGIHPSFTGQTYKRILAAATSGLPDIHVHAFSPLEISQGAASEGKSAREYLCDLRELGLGSLPGTAAEILHDDVRAVICPDKLNTAEWLQVVGDAHAEGISTTSTIMFGHVEGVEAWAAHLVGLRGLQRRSLERQREQSGERGGKPRGGRVTEFVPLPFVSKEAPIFRRGAARQGPTWRETVLMHAVSRLALRGAIDSVQVSWVKCGPEGAARILQAGANDLGGTLMNESISRAAGASHGQEMGPLLMRSLVESLPVDGPGTGLVRRRPWQRTTLYERAHEGRVDASLKAAPLSPVSFGTRPTVQ